MNPRNFTNAEMIAIAASWLDANRHRLVFLATPLMAGFIPEVELTHAALVALNPTPEAESAERQLIAVRARAVSVDRTHDRKGGGVEVVLQGAEKLADSDAEAEAVAAVRKRLFPDGAEVFSQSYLAEAGNAERVEKELADPAVRAVLQGIVVHAGRTLYDEALTFVKAGRELGVLESQKAALAAVTAAPSEGPSQRSTVSTTRNRWVQTANAILSNAKLLRKDDAKRFAPVVTEFETALAKVEARAARRRAAARADADPDATEEPAEKAAPKVTEEPLDKTG